MVLLIFFLNLFKDEGDQLWALGRTNMASALGVLPPPSVCKKTTGPTSGSTGPTGGQCYWPHQPTLTLT